jgi:hypothetical protein
MMPVIRISEPTFQRLQALAIPFEDTPSNVIERLLDLHDDVTSAGQHLEKAPAITNRGPSRSSSSGATMRSRPELDPVPDFTHARILKGSFANRVVESWNDLVHAAHRVAFAKLRSLDKVESISKSRILRGHFRTSGFHHLKDLNISIQNVSANDAWRRALHMARKLDVPIQLEVEWEQHKGAVHPGERRTIVWRSDMAR